MLQHHEVIIWNHEVDRSSMEFVCRLRGTYTDGYGAWKQEACGRSTGARAANGERHLHITPFTLLGCHLDELASGLQALFHLE